MEKPNLFESIIPCSGFYSGKRDLRLNAWLAVAAATYIAELYLLKHHPEWSPLTRGLLALTPLLPGLLYVRSWLRFIRGMDELQRRIQQEASLFAALGTVMIGVIIDTLETNGVKLPLVEQGLSLGVTYVIMLCLLPVGSAIAWCRYK